MLTNIAYTYLLPLRIVTEKYFFEYDIIFSEEVGITNIVVQTNKLN